LKSLVLDTDAVSRLIRGQLSPGLSDRLIGKVLFVTFVTVGEFYKGMHKASWGERRRSELETWLSRRPILGYDAQVSLTWGRISAETELAGRKIADNDLWIAACCLTDDIPLLTLNHRHFERIPGLKLVTID
jgi:predicted nucleic acid-binding protein